MRTIEDTPPDQRYLMVTHRLSNAAWNIECEAVRKWLANPSGSISDAESAEMLATIANPLPSTYHALLIIHCYADIPALASWDTAFDSSFTCQPKATNAVLRFSLFWRRGVLPNLGHGHHQIAVVSFPDGLPELLASLPDDPGCESNGYIGLCASDDLPEIRRQLEGAASG